MEEHYLLFLDFSFPNPDLIEKLKDGIPLTQYERPTFYTQDNFGYNTWPRNGELISFDEETEKARIGKPLA